MPIRVTGENGGGGGGVTNPLADNESLVFGTTAPFSITAQVADLVKPYGVLTVPDSSAIFITSESNKDFDYLNVDPGAIPIPIILMTNGQRVRNKNVLFGFDFQDPNTYVISASNGDDLDGTPNTANGVTLKLSSGAAGTDGTTNNAGDIFIATGGATGTGNPGNVVYNFGNNNDSGALGHFELAGNGVYNFRLWDSNSDLRVTASNSNSKYFSINVQDQTQSTTTLTDSTGNVNFFTPVRAGVSSYYFASNITPSVAPTAFFNIALPQYSGLSTANDVIDVTIGSSSTVNFVGGGVGTAASLIALDIQSRIYSADTIESWNGDICTLRLGAPILSNVFPVNGSWSLVAAGDIKLLSNLYMNGTIGMGVVPDTDNYITVAASGGAAALSQPNSGGLVLSGASDGTEAQMRLLGNIGWIDGVETAYAQFSSAATRNLVIFGGKTGSEDHLDRTMIYSQHLQIVNESVNLAPAPTVQFEIVNQTNSVIPFSIRAASGQTPSTFQITSESGGQYTAFDANGRLNVFLPTSITSAGITSVGVFGGDISTAWSLHGGGNEIDGGSALWFNSKWESGTPFAQSVYAGYSASIRNNNTDGSLEFYVHSLATNPDENVIQLKALSINQSGYLTPQSRIIGNSAAVTAANDLTIGASNVAIVSGNTTINGIATAGWAAGSKITLVFVDSPTVKNNTAASAGFASFKLAGAADFAATPDDVLTLVYNGTYLLEESRSAN